MPFLLSLLGNKWSWIALAFAISSAVIGFQRHEIKSLKISLELARQERDSCVQTNKAYEQLTKEQNRAVEALKQSYEDQAKKVALAQSKVVETNKKHQIDLANLRKQVVPQDCEGAMQWLLEKSHSPLKVTP